MFDGPRTTSDLVLLFPELSRFAVMQHLKVLVKARLVIVKREGRMRHNLLNPVPIQMIYERWVSRYQARWAGMLTDLKGAIEGPAPTTSRERSTDRGVRASSRITDHTGSLP